MPCPLPQNDLPPPALPCPGHWAQGLKLNPWQELMANMAQLGATQAQSDNCGPLSQGRGGKGLGDTV